MVMKMVTTMMDKETVQPMVMKTVVIKMVT